MHLVEKPKSKRGGKRAGAGRPAIQVIDTRERPTSVVVNLEVVEALRRMGCTLEDIAAEVGVSIRAFKYLVKKNPELKEVIENGRMRGKTSLRRMIWKKAAKGDTAAVIFLNKSENGMSDRVSHELTGKDGNPIEVKTTDVSAIRERIASRIARLAPTIATEPSSQGS